ncbi:hypothetical protein ACFYXD_16915 [Streptomyces platensis]|uniref:hypothetical protein n=1 Tax=Streptomyces platensis TaxID=58346 RepID=UPI003688EE92
MRALVIVHDHLSTAGHVGERLAERGHELDELLVVPAERYTTPDVDVAFPAAGDYGLILTLGAPWSVARRNAWIEAELALLRAAHRGGVPVLGPEVLQAWLDEDGAAIAAEVGVDSERLVAELRADLPCRPRAGPRVGGPFP